MKQRENKIKQKQKKNRLYIATNLFNLWIMRKPKEQVIMGTAICKCVTSWV